MKIGGSDRARRGPRLVAARGGLGGAPQSKTWSRSGAADGCTGALRMVVSTAFSLESFGGGVSYCTSAAWLSGTSASGCTSPRIRSGTAMTLPMKSSGSTTTQPGVTGGQIVHGVGVFVGVGGAALDVDGSVGGSEAVRVAADISRRVFCGGSSGSMLVGRGSVPSIGTMASPRSAASSPAVGKGDGVDGVVLSSSLPPVILAVCFWRAMASQIRLWFGFGFESVTTVAVRSEGHTPRLRCPLEVRFCGVRGPGRRTAGRPN